MWDLYNVCEIGKRCGRYEKKKNNNNNNRVSSLGGHYEQLRNDLRSIIMNTDKELGCLIERCQKWILSQNVNIVKKFYEIV